MKTSFVILIIILLLSNTSYTQDCSEYNNLIQESNTAFFNGNYQKAIKRYNLAMLNCPDKIAEVQDKILGVFREIERLKTGAEKALKQIESHEKTIEMMSDSTKEILADKIKADMGFINSERANKKLNEVLEALENELKKNKRIINSFYFYADRFALAYKNKLYGFIDKNGKNIIGYKYEKAAPFDEYVGLAKVERNKIKYLIDTFNTEYVVVNDIKYASLETQALDLENKNIEKLSINKKQENIEVLLLNGNRLAEFPNNIEKLKKLKILNLSENELSFIPTQIEELQALNVLDLSYNPIQNIPYEIGNLSNLKKLDLSEVTTLSDSFFRLKQLKTLKLRSNKLQNFPDLIFGLKELEELDISSNKLENIPSQIEELVKLKKLDLGSNDIKILPVQIGNLKELQVLNLRFNNFKKLPIELQKLKKLKKLDLWGNSFSNEEKEKIKKLLPNCHITF